MTRQALAKNHPFILPLGIGQHRKGIKQRQSGDPCFGAAGLDEGGRRQEERESRNSEVLFRLLKEALAGSGLVGLLVDPAAAITHPADIGITSFGRITADAVIIPELRSSRCGQ